MVSALLADLVARGLDVESGVLCVIDGGQGARRWHQKGLRRRRRGAALHSAQAPKFEGHLPKELARAVDKRLAIIFAQLDAAKGLDAARRLAKKLQADHPDAAASIARGARRDVHRTTPGHPRHTGQDTHQYELHRVDDLDRQADAPA